MSALPLVVHHHQFEAMQVHCHHADHAASGIVDGPDQDKWLFLMGKGESDEILAC